MGLKIRPQEISPVYVGFELAGNEIREGDDVSLQIEEIYINVIVQIVDGGQFSGLIKSFEGIYEKAVHDLSIGDQINFQYENIFSVLRK